LTNVAIAHLNILYMQYTNWQVKIHYKRLVFANQKILKKV